MINWRWLAGFWEGEGSCGTYKTTKHYYTLQVSITQKNIKVLRKIKVFLGYGNLLIRKHKKEKYGYLYFWGNNARYFLNKILIYSNHSDKRKQINKALNLDKKYVQPRKR